jgi:alkanesulfonate monooxygenase
MATVTRHLGFGITGTVSYEQPFSFARKVSTLDHLTKGSMAWNIVTGYLDSAAKAFGLKEQLPHDERYVMAAEFMEVVYKLWEGSWEDDAVRRDKANRIFADPEKMHKVFHDGKYFRMEGYHLCEPSPQRTPILFQAGSSSQGRQFAAQHAECVFIGGFERKVVAEIVADLRARAASVGRDPASLIICMALVAIAGKTDAEAEAKLADYRKHVSTEGSLALLSGYLGLDLASKDLDQPLESQDINAIRSFVDGLKRRDPNRIWTLRDAADSIGVAGYKATLTGSPTTIADGLMGWMEETGIDGFNIEYIVSPGDFVAFVDLVVPELQRRGVHKTSYEEGTLREKLYGPGRRHLSADHPGAGYRFGGAFP